MLDGDKHSCCGSSVLTYLQEKVRFKAEARGDNSLTKIKLQKKKSGWFSDGGGSRKIYRERGKGGARTLLLPSLGGYVFIG